MTLQPENYNIRNMYRHIGYYATNKFFPGNMRMGTTRDMKVYGNDDISAYGSAKYIDASSSELTAGFGTVGE